MPLRARPSGTSTKTSPCGAACSRPRAASCSTARWTAGSRPWTRRTGTSCGSSKSARGSSETPSRIWAPTANSTSRSIRESAGGWARWRSPTCRRRIRTRVSVSQGRSRTSRRPRRWAARCMCFRSRLAVLCVVALAACRGEGRALGVCADPNNLPFSNDKLEGFENKLAEMVGQELGRPIRYTWMPQRRGFVRNTLRAGKCDVIMGVPSSFELARPTEPYYRSTYVFVSRRDRHLHLTSLDDARLKHLRIGVHVIGYSIYGDYSKPNPPADLIDAVIRGDVDVAIAWGPLAGYFAGRSTVPLDVGPVSPQIDLPFLPLVFDISMAVRRGDDSLRARLDAVIEHRQREIERLLEQYGVPLLPLKAES